MTGMPTRLQNVNTTDIAAAIHLGCRCMQKAFNAQDADIPFFGARVRPIAELSGSNESHIPGRHLNALLNAENALGLTLDEDCIDKHARAANAKLWLARMTDAHPPSSIEPITSMASATHKNALGSSVPCQSNSKPGQPRCVCRK